MSVLGALSERVQALTDNLTATPLAESLSYPSPASPTLLFAHKPLPYRLQDFIPLDPMTAEKRMLAYIETQTSFLKDHDSKKLNTLDEFIGLYIASPHTFPKDEQNEFLCVVREAGHAVYLNGWQPKTKISLSTPAA